MAVSVALVSVTDSKADLPVSAVDSAEVLEVLEVSVADTHLHPDSLDSDLAVLALTVAVVFLLHMALQAALAHYPPATVPQVPADHRPVTAPQVLPADLIKLLMKS